MEHLSSAAIQTRVYQQARIQVLATLSAERLAWIKGLAEEIRDAGSRKRDQSTDAELADTIRKVRRSAQEMRAVLRLLGETEAVPKKFNEFIVALGRFRDAIEAKKMEAKKAEDLLRVMIDFDLLASETLQFSPTPSESMKGRVFQRIQEMNVAYPLRPVGRSETHTLSQRTYHDLRKNFRDFEVVLSLMRLTEQTESFRGLEKILNEASKKMGEANDSYEREILKARAKEKKYGLKRGTLTSKVTSDLEVPFSAPFAAEQMRIAFNLHLSLVSFLYRESFTRKFKKQVEKGRVAVCPLLLFPSDEEPDDADLF